MNRPSYVTVLVDPRNWFDRLDETPSLRWPLLIIGGIMVVDAAASLLWTAEVAVAYQDATIGGIDLSQQNVFGLSFWQANLLETTISVGLGTVGLFILFVGVLHLLSVGVGGRGTLRETAAIAAWGHVPLLLGSMLWLALLSIILGSVPAPQNPMGGISRWVMEIESHPLYVLRSFRENPSVIPTAFYVWTSFIWAVGLSAVQEIRMRRSAVIAIVAAGVGGYISEFVWPVFYYIQLLANGRPILAL